MSKNCTLRMSIATLTLWVYSLSAALAQTTVTGKVTDEQKKPIAGVTVSALPGKVKSVTNNQGDYTLSLPDGNYLISYSYVGFIAVTKEVKVAGSPVTLNTDLAATAANLEELIVSTGTRASQRTMTTSTVPVDIITAADLSSTGQPSFDKSLQYRVPSFSTVNTPVNDATSLLDPYEIRNMGPSRTLILINGKRKNASSLTYVQSSPGRGETGADLSAIPSDAIKRVEILRDGASAQYGSDAIAGVMNIILKDKYEYGSVIAKSAITHKGDGAMIGMALNNGANFGNKGYINYTIDLQHTNRTNRAGKVSAEGEAATFGVSVEEAQAYLDKFPDANNPNGTPANSSAKFLVNGGSALSDNTEIYFNAAYVYKKVISNANYRTPYWKSDYGLLHAAGTEYIGFGPTFEGDLNDYNGTIGFRSEKNGWKTDMSFTTGGNKQLYTVNNTINESLGSSSPISFKPGGFTFSNNIGNIDISRKLSSQLNVAFGTEFRVENYSLVAGDTASVRGSGAISFPGYGSANAIKSTRYNFGGYLDLSYDVTDDFLVNGTIRAENYSDFGDAFVWKISSRYKLLDDKITIRGSVSTGFRAPSLSQINLQLSQASFSGGTIQTSGIVSNNSPQARLLGVPKLEPEKSTNFTAGLGLKPTSNLNITVDYYNIKLKNRILLSDNIGPGDGPGSEGLNTVLQQNGIVSVGFFVNGMHTRTQGLDFVANYRNIALGNGKLGLNLAGNYTLENKNLALHNPPLIAAAGKNIVTDQNLALILTSRPKFKYIAGLDYKIKHWTFNLDNTVFGPVTFHDSDNGLDANLDTKFKTRVTTDLSFSVQLTRNLTFFGGVQNIFNVLPKWDFIAKNAEGEALLKSPAAVAANYNGITFDGRYQIVPYNGSHFSILGTTFSASLKLTF
ncbi:iron complex outermembrane recepter protein [Filimonas lacunae]|uniref:Iron complex outermembrane recepter protein n=1 Tax=Filimonas lacunae TaxID=477680 RepID=A0A173MEJ0_9BACT|nr:TonB-dependent receptor [Filimonas lacunae]BAV05899.1 TonB-dependent receptor [Filimonas lacunae]SIT34548.1 iron complex outermembrane recepter protein [Filimonas lacunae]